MPNRSAARDTGAKELVKSQPVGRGFITRLVGLALGAGFVAGLVVFLMEPR